MKKNLQAVEAKSKVRSCIKIPSSLGPLPSIDDWGCIPSIDRFGLQSQNVGQQTYPSNYTSILA